jgi:type IV pilus assembly protein PilV
MQLKHMAGFMLIELLVALVLTALGIAAWLHGQASALQQTRLNQHRTLAMMLAADMAEILRASPAHAGAMDHAGDPATGLAASTSPCQSQTCDAPAWAAAELWQWRDRVRQSLPEGLSQIRVEVPARTAHITLGWREGADQSLVADRPAYLQCPLAWAGLEESGLRCLTFEVGW